MMWLVERRSRVGDDEYRKEIGVYSESCRDPESKQNAGKGDGLSGVWMQTVNAIHQSMEQTPPEYRR